MRPRAGASVLCTVGCLHLTVHMLEAVSQLCRAFFLSDAMIPSQSHADGAPIVVIDFTDAFQMPDACTCLQWTLLSGRVVLTDVSQAGVSPTNWRRSYSPPAIRCSRAVMVEGLGGSLFVLCCGCWGVRVVVFALGFHAFLQALTRNDRP